MIHAPTLARDAGLPGPCPRPPSSGCPLRAGGQLPRDSPSAPGSGASQAGFLSGILFPHVFSSWGLISHVTSSDRPSLPSCDGVMVRQRCPRPHARDLRRRHLTWQKGLSRYDYGKDFERRRLSWVIWQAQRHHRGPEKETEGGEGTRVAGGHGTARRRPEMRAKRRNAGRPRNGLSRELRRIADLPTPFDV